MPFYTYILYFKHAPEIVAYVGSGAKYRPRQSLRDKKEKWGDIFTDWEIIGTFVMREEAITLEHMWILALKANGQAVFNQRTGTKITRTSAEDQQKQYKKTHWETNKEKYRTRKREIYREKCDEILEQQKDYYQKNKERIKARQKAYREANRERISARRKELHRLKKLSKNDA